MQYHVIPDFTEEDQWGTKNVDFTLAAVISEIVQATRQTSIEH